MAMTFPFLALTRPDSHKKKRYMLSCKLKCRTHCHYPCSAWHENRYNKISWPKRHYQPKPLWPWALLLHISWSFDSVSTGIYLVRDSYELFFTWYLYLSDDIRYKHNLITPLHCGTSIPSDRTEVETRIFSSPSLNCDITDSASFLLIATVTKKSFDFFLLNREKVCSIWPIFWRNPLCLDQGILSDC